MYVCVCVCVYREREREKKKEIYDKELAHVIMAADKWQVPRSAVGWEADGVVLVHT